MKHLHSVATGSKCAPIDSPEVVGDTDADEDHEQRDVLSLFKSGSTDRGVG